MKKLKLFFACLLMAVLSIGQVWGAVGDTYTQITGKLSEGTHEVLIAVGDYNTSNSATSGSSYIASDKTTGTYISLSAVTFGGSAGAYTYVCTDAKQIYTIVVDANGDITSAKSSDNTYFSPSTSSNKLLTDEAGMDVEVSGNCYKWSKTSGSNTYYVCSQYSYNLRAYKGKCGNAKYCCDLILLEKASTPACSNTVSVTKVAPENGDFNISATEVCGDGDGGEVTISNIEPATGYTLDEVSVTVGTYNALTGKVTGITDDTEITVTFKALPKYTVSFNTGAGNPAVSPIAEATGGAGITLPAGPTPACSADGWTFAGWAAAAVGAETTNAPTLLAAGTNYKPAEDVTLYAVYKRTEGGSGASGSVEIDLSTTNFPTSYGTANTFTEYTLENYKFKIQQIYVTGSGDNKKHQWRAAGNSSGTGTIYNTQVYPAKISSIVLTYHSSDANKNHTLKVGNTENPASGTSITGTTVGTVETFDCSSEDADYFVLANGSNAGYTTSIQINYGAPSTTYYLSTPTCAAPTCEDLGTPVVNVTNKTYNSAKLTWAAVDNADKYLVKFNGVDQEATENLYFDATGLEAEETYTYQVKALAEEGQDDYCDGDFSTEAGFTTEEAPDATLTLSERGTTHAYSGSHKVGDVVALPAEAEECNKTFVGWSANPSCAVAPEFAPGASYTLVATSQTLYAVYATPTGNSIWEEIFAAPTAGDYAIYSDGHLMEAAISSNRFQNAAASVTDGKLDATPAASCIWTVSINASDYFQFKNGTKYASSTNSNNQGALTEDATDTKAQWTIAYSEGFVIENVGRKAAGGNYTLRNNGDYGWGSYGASTGTAPRLFKKMVTYTDFSTSCTAALAAPTFSVDPDDGPFTTAQSVELSATEGTIYYNINSADDPTSASTPYTGAIDVDACGSTTIKAIAISSTNQSLVASATYVLNLPIPENAENNPYSIATAKSVIDGGCYNNEDVYVTGTVASAQLYNSGTYTVTLEDGFQFYYLYKAAGETPFDSGDETIEAGDVLVAFGKLGMHNTTYQLDHGYLVSRTPAPKTPIDSDIDNPISVAAAINYIDNAATYDLSEDEFVAGIVESIAECPQHEGTYDIIVLDATDNTKQMKFFGCDVKTFTGIKQYDQITGKGKLDKYYSTYELNYPCEVVALTPYVAPIVDVTGVEVDETATVKVGKTVQLTANVLPANASNKNVTWSVKAGDESKASVSATGLVTGLAEGEAVIVVTTEEGSFTDECTVTVTAGINFAAGDFVLVEDAAELTEGTYVIVAGAGENNVAMKYHAGNSDGNHKGKAAVKEGKYLHYDADFGVYEIKDYVVEEVKQGISFYNENAENYFALPGNSNQLKTSTEQNNNSSWTVAVSEGITTLTNKALTGRTLRYNINSGSPIFACYTSGQQPIALYKYVTPAAYRVYYDDNVAEEEIEVPVYQSVNGENKVTITTVEPVRDGYLFGGWKDGEANVYEAGVEYTLSADLTLYAQWTTATVSTLSYNPNGGTLIDGETAIADADVAEGTNLTIEANVYEKGDNFVFAGWQLGDDVYQPGDPFVMPATDVEFVAKWDAVEVSDYTLVTDVAQLQAWDKIIIVAANYNVAAGSAAATYRNPVTIGKTASKNKLILAGYGTPTEFTLGIPTAGEYTFNDGDGYMYESAAKSIKVREDSYSWSISIDGEAIATITGTNALQYNATSGQERFTTYASSQQALQLYRKPGTAPEPPTKDLVRGDLENGKWGTLCPKQTVENVEGATFYQISYLEEQNNLPYNVVFDQIEGTTLTAGKPYFFIAGGEEIRGNKTGDAVTSGSNVNGFYGYISSTDASMELTTWHADYTPGADNTFVIYDNSVFRINQEGTKLKSERCYININSTEPSRTAKSSIPGRRRISMSVQNTNVATGVDAINASETPMKLMIDGQLFILRGEKMYDATGRLVK